MLRGWRRRARADAGGRRPPPLTTSRRPMRHRLTSPTSEPEPGRADTTACHTAPACTRYCCPAGRRPGGRPSPGGERRGCCPPPSSGPALHGSHSLWCRLSTSESRERLVDHSSQRSNTWSWAWSPRTARPPPRSRWRAGSTAPSGSLVPDAPEETFAPACWNRSRFSSFTSSVAFGARWTRGRTSRDALVLSSPRRARSGHDWPAPTPVGYHYEVAKAASGCGSAW